MQYKKIENTKIINIFYGTSNYDFVKENLLETEVFKFNFEFNSNISDGFLVKPTMKCDNIIFYFRGGTGEYGETKLGFCGLFLAWLAKQGYCIYTINYLKDEVGGIDQDEYMKLINEVKKTHQDCIFFLLSFSRGSINLLKTIETLDWFKKVILVAPLIDLDLDYQLRPDLKLFRKDYYDSSNQIENNKRNPVKFFKNKYKSDISILYSKLDKTIPIIPIQDFEEKYKNIKTIEFDFPIHAISHYKEYILEILNNK